MMILCQTENESELEKFESLCFTSVEVHKQVI